MAAFTIGQNQALDDHIQWCREIITDNKRSIELFESGKMHISRNREDMTTEWIATLKKQNESLERLVATFKPAEFQKQVK